MYFARKVDEYLDNWLKTKEPRPILLVGIRQCGKTEAVREFAKRNNLQLIEMNFWTNPEYCSDFSTNLSVDNIISNISLRFPNTEIKPGKTLIFFDEIQDCPRARLSFKNFAKDGRYHVVGSGSYLGINGYIIGDNTPAPTGYDDVYHMKTMDFEEFLWALGYKKEQTEKLVSYFDNNEKIPENIHNMYKDIFLKYVCIGGFPRVVLEYIKTHNIVPAFNILKSIIFDMKSDFGRRMDKAGNPIFKSYEVARIQNAFDLMPTFLAKENKRFIVSKVKSGSQYDKNDAIEYLRQAHIVFKVHNVSVPTLPLSGERIDSQFKLFPEDIGVITSMYGIDTISGINKGELGQGKGAIYEAIVCESLLKAGIEPYYFAKESGLEVDFVISYNGYSTLVESKAKNGNTKSSKTVMNHPEHYGKTKLIKIGDYNINKDGDITTIPHYLIFALGKIKYDF